MNAAQWIEQLQLQPHPEGGYYRETYHAETWMTDIVTEQTFGDVRRSATSIYFLLESGDVSHLHRLKSDEIWYFHTGSALTIHVIDPNGHYFTKSLGLDIEHGQQPQICIPKQHIFGATLDAPTAAPYGLVSCMVSPGFDFRDFELLTRRELERQYPQHQSLIRRLALD